MLLNWNLDKYMIRQNKFRRHKRICVPINLHP